MKKNILIFSVLMLLCVGGLRAQHFEWAKGYSSSQEGNIIKGSVTDSAGNLYILGQFRNTAAWDGGSHLLPIAPYGYGSDVLNVLIAKITPDGTMAWKKVLHANNGQGANAWDIKLVGDSAFACMAVMALPTEENYSYYLDTLLIGRSDCITPHAGMGVAQRTALIIFNFEGNVLEQHFLTLTYIDNEGNDFKYGEWYMNNGYLLNISFDIDNEGNIYICRQAADVADGNHSPWQGNISGIKYWVDGRVVGTSATDNKPQGWFPHLLKFSPHMDTLLASRYLVQRSDSVEYQTLNLYMKLDWIGNPYVVGTIIEPTGVSNTIVFDTIHNLSFSHTAANHYIPYFIKLNTLLIPEWCIGIEDSVILPEMEISNNTFHEMYIDSDSSMLFLSASTGRGYFDDTVNYYSILRCQGVTLSGLRNDGFIMCFKEQDNLPILYSYGRVPSKVTSSFTPCPYCHGNLATKNNYVFAQARYHGGILLPGQDITSPLQNQGLGLMIFDYKCKIHNGIDYHTTSPNNDPGPICLKDSVIYLTNYLASDATFGDIHVPAQGYNACVAKYVDTAFMTPYVPPTVHIGQAEAIPLRLYPNPTHGTVRIDTGGEPVRSAALLTVYGQRTPLQVDGDRIELTGCPAGVYILEITTNNQKYHQKIIVL